MPSFPDQRSRFVPRHRSSAKAIFLALLCAGLLLGAVPAIPARAAPPPAGYDTAKVKATVNNQELGSIPIRQGFYDGDADLGWGFDKAVHKHNITSLTAHKRIMASPTIYYQQTQATYRLTLYAGRYTCSGSKCTLTDKRTVYGIYNPNSYNTYYGQKVGGKMGMLTAYCVNPNNAAKCPNWVTNAIVNPGQPSGQATAGRADGPSSLPSGGAWDQNDPASTASSNAAPLPSSKKIQEQAANQVGKIGSSSYSPLPAEFDQ